MFKSVFTVLIDLHVLWLWVTAKRSPAVFTSALHACLCSVFFQSSWTMSLCPSCPQMPAWGQRENPAFCMACYSFIGFDCCSFTSCFNRKTGPKPSVNCLWLGFLDGFKAGKLLTNLYGYAKRLYIIQINQSNKLAFFVMAYVFFSFEAKHISVITTTFIV